MAYATNQIRFYYFMALNGHQKGDKGYNNQQKTSAFNGGVMEHDDERWGAWGGHDSIVSMATM
jgi:hypothetical protein